MKLVLSWMREFADVPADVTADAVASRLAACGFEVAEVIAGAEPVVDFEVPANRPDCLSVVGLAREASVAFGVRFVDGSNGSEGSGVRTGSGSAGSTSDTGSGLSVTVEDPDLCPRYAAQVARVTIAPSPSWLADRLHAAGVRPINNVVDVTNYVMLERGHPMHAFDLDTLAERSLIVRRARPGERLRTLDGVDRALDPDMLVIADARRATAIAGVMGGAASEVSEGTSLIALESAWFLPRSVRATSRRLALKSEASARFERGADVEAAVKSLDRAMTLLRETGAGDAAGPIIDRYVAQSHQSPLPLRGSRIAHLLGEPVQPADVERILTGLGFRLEHSRQANPNPSNPPNLANWSVSVPSWRVDAQREADLIEEVGRHVGFDQLPTTFPALTEVPAAPDRRIARDQLARRVMMGSGFDEAVTITFIERSAAEPYAPEAERSTIANPLSEKFVVLRPSLLPGLLDALAHNRRHGQAGARMFETGACFTTSAGERRHVAFAWTGLASDEHWSAAGRTVDFFDARGVCEELCGAFGVTIVIEPARVAYLVDGRTARLFAGEGGPELGAVGQLVPAIVEARDMPGRDPVYVGELDLDALASGTPSGQRLAPLPRFPTVVRDLSILVSDRLPAADVRGTIRSAAPATLEAVREFDRYQGKGIPEGRVSLSFHLTFRASDRTLTDAEVDEVMTGIVRALEVQHGASRR